jgi:hypothetical protein
MRVPLQLLFRAERKRPVGPDAQFCFLLTDAG